MSVYRHDPATCRDGDHYGQCSGATRVSVFHCPNCKRLIQVAGNGTTGAPWVIPGHPNPADGEPCPESGAQWSRAVGPYTSGGAW